MLSIALFPCSYTDGARLVGELANALNVKMYTDALLVEDVSSQCGIEAEDIRKWLYGTPSSMNRLTLDKEKYVNLFKRFLVNRLSQPVRYLFYGYLAALIGPGDSKHVLKILVVDSKNGRVARAMKQEGWSRSKAEEMVDLHDRRVSEWTRFLYNSDAYNYSLYDIIISYDSRNMLEVKEEIVRRCNSYDRSVIEKNLQEEAGEMELAAAVERVLLEGGYKAGVKIVDGLVKLKVEVSSYHFPWLAHKLTELSRSVNGVREVKVERAL